MQQLQGLQGQHRQNPQENHHQKKATRLFWQLLDRHKKCLLLQSGAGAFCFGSRALNAAGQWHSNAGCKSRSANIVAMYFVSLHEIFHRLSYAMTRCGNYKPVLGN